MPPEIRSALIEMGRQLALNLEYFPDNMTGNHVINNARGLLLFGALANETVFCDLADAVFQATLNDLLTDEGHLREGSSHYHFLFLKWVAECTLFAQDARLQDNLAQCLEKLIDAAEFYLIARPDGKITIPMLGDISPDVTPDDLLSSLASLSKTWRSSAPKTVLSLLERLSGYLEDGSKIPEGVIHVEGAGLVRVEAQNWVLFMSVAAGEASLKRLMRIRIFQHRWFIMTGLKS